LNGKADHDSHDDYHGFVLKGAAMDDASEVPLRIPEWSSAEAKARLSEIIELTQENGPQIITRNGKPRAVLVSVADWEERRPRGNLYRLLRSAPEGADGLNFENAPRLRESAVF
jgi:prevent-host-death family protein